MRIIRFFLFLLLLGGTSGLQANVSDRKTLFDKEWRFFRGAVAGAEAFSYEDTSWRKLDLPHDWSVEPLPEQEPDQVVGPFSRKSIGGFATGQTVGARGGIVKLLLFHPRMLTSVMNFILREYTINRRSG